MQVEISRLEQVFSFEDKKMTTFLIFTLPGVGEIKAAISDQDSEVVVEVVMGSQAVEAPEVEKAAVEDDDEEYESNPMSSAWTTLPPASDPELISWMELPDEVLPINLKRKLAQAAAPDLLSLEDIKARLTPTLPQIPRSQMVSVDDMGNPVVPQREQYTDDEDGVAQL